MMTLVNIEKDKQQRYLALDTSQSFIVQAPAGSGKTELIIQRFLSLLTQVDSPEEILAITFTKKATSEMRSRIILSLQHAQTSPLPESAHAQLTWSLANKVLQRDQQFKWNLLSNPNQLRIQTIDSLCAYLAKQLPLLSHFGSSPRITEQPTVLYREAVQEILMHLETDLSWSPALEKLLLHLDNDLNKLSELLIDLLAKRDQWMPYIHLTRHEDEMKKQLEYHFSLVVSEKLRNLHSLFPKDMVKELLNVAHCASDQLILANQQMEIIYCRHLTELPGMNGKDVNAWMGLAKLLLTKGMNWRKRVDKDIGFPSLSSIKNPQLKKVHVEFRERYKWLIDQLSMNEPLRLALIQIFSLPKAFYEEDQWEILKALLYVLKIAVAQLHLVFKQYGQIDFIENAQAALTALGDEENITDLTLALDYQIRHILIDEFQDTALTQYRLLEKLTAGWETNDGRTLFIVGDPMQSIYRFREAEVGLFLRIWQYGIGQIKLSPLRLNINFRSSEKIVQWNNQLFQSIFPAHNDVAMGAVTYHSSISNHLMDEFQPEVHGFVTQEANIQEQHIVLLMNDLQKASSTDSIAILVRSRGDLITLLPALKQANIAYEAVDIESLASRQIIQDLLALTCALLHPMDRISWLAILRAPWCGLKLADLLTIVGNNVFTPIWERLQSDDMINQLSDDGKQRINRILPILKTKIADRERQPLRYWIENTWMMLGGPACLHDYSSMSDVNTFFELLELINQQDLTIGVDHLQAKVEKLYAASTLKLKQDNPIRIMTIHTAKGLEFDTVILPHLESTTPADDRSLLLYMDYALADDQVALLLAPIHSTGHINDAMYEFIFQQKKIKAEFESDRLFYVAATRAKKRLHLFFDVTQNADGNYKIPAGSFLEKIWPQISASCQASLGEDISSLSSQEIVTGSSITFTQDTSTQRDEVQSARSNRYVVRLDSEWKNPVKFNDSFTTAYHQNQIGFAFRESKPRIIGTIIHKNLQLISMHGKKWWETITDQYIKHQLLRLEILSNEIESAINIVRQAMENTLKDARGQWILHSHRAAQSEFAISAVIDGEVQRLMIDRTFIDETGTRWIIDYKTNTLSNEQLNDFLQQQREKYLEKMTVYSQAMRTIDTRPIRLGLYFPVLSAWHEWSV